MKNFNHHFSPELGVAQCETFSQIYPEMNKYLVESKEWQNSRAGEVKELLDVKTRILNPYRRCVGGYHRNMNVFFLLAEAIWIAAGGKDVEFLTIFNNQMKEFSDDGRVFHAPYGWRLRSWGAWAEQDDKVGYDQLKSAVSLLGSNPTSRQVVMSIWNPIQDLGFKSKDLPCNDIVMLKIRDGKLVVTIGNRSNDLHWGLPTNVFQFSFLSEIIAASLGIELGTQTHNSQSLHIYKWNDISERMHVEYENDPDNELYRRGAVERKMDFDFVSETAVNRFAEIDYYLRVILSNLMEYYKEGTQDRVEIDKLHEFSRYLYDVYTLLKIYIDYKKEEKTDAVRLNMKNNILLTFEGMEDWDVIQLACNFFDVRMKAEDFKKPSYL